MKGGQHMNQHTGSRSTEPLSRVIAIPAGILLGCVSAFADSLAGGGMTPGLGWVQRFGIIMGAVLAVWGIWGIWAARR